MGINVGCDPKAAGQAVLITLEFTGCGRPALSMGLRGLLHLS